VLSTTHNNYKAIVCQNVASSLKKLQEELIIYNIDNNYIGDVVIVEGKLHTELKGEITKSFNGCINDVESLTNDDDCFYACILLGTTECIGAGLDCDDVHLVIRIGVPNSIVNFIQEIGRCGRKNRECLKQNNTATDHCVLLYNVEDFCYMEQRIHSGNNDDESKMHQLHELYRVLRLITLDQEGCWHALLENECKHIMYSGVNIL
jgi:superfamily II DNA/RNA helicase